MRNAVLFAIALSGCAPVAGVPRLNDNGTASCVDGDRVTGARVLCAGFVAVSDVGCTAPYAAGVSCPESLFCLQHAALCGEPAFCAAGPGDFCSLAMVEECARLGGACVAEIRADGSLGPLMIE